MKFTVLERRGRYPTYVRNEVFLISDNWDDFGFRTTFGIVYVDDNSIEHELSGVKIGHVGQTTYQRVLDVGYSFDRLSSGYFSLGTSEDYYENLKKLDSDVRDEILTSLNDLAKNQNLFLRNRNESVVVKSLLRDINPSTVTGQFHRMTEGGAMLTKYSFDFTQSNFDGSGPLELSFDVVPESLPPTNVHVIIGRNGVGKTYLLNSMIDALMLEGYKQMMGGRYKFHKDPWGQNGSFSNVISVSFSAFDEIVSKPSSTPFIDDIKYSNIGLKKELINDSQTNLIKNPSELAKEFYKSLRLCNSRTLSKRWLQAVSTLQSDPNFNEARIDELINLAEDKSNRDQIVHIFRGLSSGHKIVLLTITRLIEKLQERSLLIMDEPESHLHPPLLSAFIRAVSDLLIMINGVAIVATHSPVILQEVPRNCAWKLRRSGSTTIAERLSRESFGENVGILTNDVFGLEVTESGFYKMLSKVVEDFNYDYDKVVGAFNGQLGMEARSILMAIISTRS